MRITIMSAALLAITCTATAEHIALKIDPTANNLAAIQELVTAINTANANSEPDTIVLFKEGRYLFSGSPVFEHEGVCALPSVVSPEKLILDGNGATLERADDSPAFRFLRFAKDSRATVSNLTFINGAAVADTQAHDWDGGAILNWGSLVIENCVFERNHCSKAGGAVFNVEPGLLTIRDSVFKNNSSDWVVGAVDNVGTVELIENCVFENNKAADDGGAVGCAGPMKIRNCTFTNNESGYRGGALRVWKTIASVENCTFKGNRSANIGGAISLLRAGGDLKVRNCTFTENTSGANGGAIDNQDASLEVEKSNFAKNSAGMASGGAIASSGVTRVNSSVFDGNSAHSGGAVAVYRALEVTGSQFVANEALHEGGAITITPGRDRLSAIIADSTFTENKCDADENGMGDGGAISFTGVGAVAVRESRIFKNVDFGGEAPDVFGPITSAGDNLVFDPAGTVSFTWDITGAEAATIVESAE